MDLKELVEEAYGTAVEKGWYENGPRPIPELLMLTVSELSEALEEYRRGCSPTEIYFEGEALPATTAPAAVTITTWIITGVKDEHYPCKADIFEMTYEPVETPVPPACPAESGKAG